MARVTMPGPVPLFFLAYILLFLPWAAWRSARLLREAAGGSAPGGFTREDVWVRSLIGQLILLLLAWFVAGRIEFDILATRPFRAGDVAAAGTVLALFLALRVLARAIHPENERGRLLVYWLAPRTPREVLFWIATVLTASVAEEAAYRGVAMSILWYSLGNPWIAALVCAIAFALAHSAQGWKSGVVIFVMGLVMHALVAVTSTLVVAMAVHATYDLVAGVFIRREEVRRELAGPARS